MLGDRRVDMRLGCVARPEGLMKVRVDVSEDIVLVLIRTVVVDIGWDGCCGLD